MKFNLINLHDQIRDENSALKFLQDRVVIKSSSLCATCNAHRPAPLPTMCTSTVPSAGSRSQCGRTPSCTVR